LAEIIIFPQLLSRPQEAWTKGK